MPTLDLRRLAVFVQVYQTQSVSRAAQNLGIAQASAGIALNKLRRHFDEPLFSRTAKGMEPTTPALRMYPELRDALAGIEHAC